jgi:hypothetical protein
LVHRPRNHGLDQLQHPATEYSGSNAPHTRCGMQLHAAVVDLRDSETQATTKCQQTAFCPLAVPVVVWT